MFVNNLLLLANPILFFGVGVLAIVAGIITITTVVVVKHIKAKNLKSKVKKDNKELKEKAKKKQKELTEEEKAENVKERQRNLEKNKLASEEENTVKVAPKKSEQVVAEKDFEKNSQYDYVYRIEFNDKVYQGKTDDLQVAKADINKYLSECRNNVYLDPELHNLSLKVKVTDNNGEVKFLDKHYEITHEKDDETLTTEFFRDMEKVCAVLEYKQSSEQKTAESIKQDDETFEKTL